MSEAMKRFLAPDRVALVGAARSDAGPSGLLIKALNDYERPGDVYLVNPGGHVIGGRQSVRSVGELPDGIDLALVMVPATAVVDVVAHCADKGFGGAVVYSAGFADDQDAQGAAREAALAEVTSRTGMRVLGPNSQGFLNLADQVVTSFSPAVQHHAIRSALGNDDVASARGNVAVIAQSGGLGFSLLARGLRRGIRFSHVISTGNEVDLEVHDFLEHFIDDPATDVVLMYIEGLKDPSRFAAMARRARANGTRLVAAKVGASPAGQRAALSHTGHISGDDRSYQAVFRRHGVVSVSDPDEMLDVALALASCRPAAGPRVAVVSASGGSAVWLADALAAKGLELPELSGESRQRLRAMLPTFASAANPIDISGGAAMGPAEVLAAIADDPNIDALVLATTLARPERIELDRDVLTTLAARTDKPTIVYTYTEPSPLAQTVLGELGLPLYSGIASCAAGVASLVLAGSADPDDGIAAAGPLADEAIAAARARILAGDADVLCEYEAKAALDEAGVTITCEVLAADAADAVRAAEEIGYPVALKVQSPDVPHKAAAGGVALGCTTASEVEVAYARVIAATADSVPDARVHGVLVQAMAPPGVELLVGVQNQSGFGPIVVVGIGGALVEVIDRTVAYPAPFGRATAERLLAELGIDRVIHDLGPLADLVSTVSVLADAASDVVSEMDLNPVVVERGTGAVHLVDALISR